LRSNSRVERSAWQLETHFGFPGLIPPAYLRPQFAA
jgi:hypothetical protein